MTHHLLALLALGCVPGADPGTDLGPTTLIPTDPAPTPTGPDPTGATGDTGGATVTTPGTVADCEGGATYPPGAVEPMAFGQVFSAYSWPSAVDHATGAVLDLDLAQVPCALDPDIDWSPFDVLLFVSIPAW